MYNIYIKRGYNLLTLNKMFIFIKNHIVKILCFSLILLTENTPQNISYNIYVV